jgi:hypothetical protein
MRIDMTLEEMFDGIRDGSYSLEEFESYTAAVEAKERERIADALNFLRLNPMQFQGSPEDFVRSLK